MKNFPLHVFSGQQSRAIDQFIRQEKQLTSYALMQQAGQAAFELLKTLWPKAHSVIICCGPGNNGGDGYVLARLAKQTGLRVTLYQTASVPSHLPTTETEQVRQEWLAIGGEIHPYQNQPLIADVLVDALLGTGVRHPLLPAWESLIEAMNRSLLPILSLDIPSGLNADTGFASKAVKASATVTFLTLKTGLLLETAVDYVGELYFNDLGVPESYYIDKFSPHAIRLAYEQVITALKPRKLAAHKGDQGHVCLIGGGEAGFCGAIGLAAKAALKAGVGLASVLVAPASLPLLARAPLEVMCHGYDEPFKAQDLLAKANVMVIGPGLSQNSWAKSFFQAALRTQKPLLVDADGLNLLAQYSEHRDNWILTPHLGEAARLLKLTVAEIQQDKVAAALALQKTYGGTVVLKGAGTLIIDKQKRIFINDGAFPSLATGGTGDILAGLIAGLWAQGLSALDAAKIGVVVHAAAAKKEQALGSRGMLASDLLLHWRELLNPGSENVIPCS